MGNCVSQTPATKDAPSKRAQQSSSKENHSSRHNHSRQHHSAGSTASGGSKYGRYGSKAYTVVKDLEVGEGSESTTLKLMRNNTTNDLVAAKWVPREAGAALSRATEREIINHRRLRHPNIVCFREVCLTLRARSSVEARIRLAPVRGLLWQVWCVSIGHMNYLQHCSAQVI